MIALAAWLAAWLSSDEGPYTIIAACAAVAGLAVLIWSEFIAPRVHLRRLRHPCDVRFVVRRQQHASINYLLQDDDDHVLDEIVLPSHKVVEIEVGFIPKVPIHLRELILGCEGEADAKPFIVEALDRFTEAGKKNWLPGDDGHSRDVHKHWHVIRNLPYAAGTHRVITFRVQTRDPGVYPFQISFVTDEIEGSAELTIRVEDRPMTRMRCRSHDGCLVRPIAVIADSPPSQ